jgi:hypothetical protein
MSDDRKNSQSEEARSFDRSHDFADSLSDIAEGDVFHGSCDFADELGDNPGDNFDDDDD